MQIELTDQEYKVLNALLIMTQMEYKGRGIHTDTIDSIIDKLDKDSKDEDENEFKSRYKLIEDANQFRISSELLKEIGKQSPQSERLKNN
jgi:hypothetical protein